MTQVYAALEEQVFHVSQTQWEADIHQDRQADDLGRRVKIAERIVGLAHPSPVIDRRHAMPSL